MVNSHGFFEQQPPPTHNHQFASICINCLVSPATTALTGLHCLGEKKKVFLTFRTGFLISVSEEDASHDIVFATKNDT